jgi:hypothetical protein
VAPIFSCVVPVVCWPPTLLASVLGGPFSNLIGLVASARGAGLDGTLRLVTCRGSPEEGSPEAPIVPRPLPLRDRQQQRARLVELGIQVVGVVEQQGLERLRHLGAVPLRPPLMRGDEVLEMEEAIGREDTERFRLPGHHLDPDHDVTEELPLSGVEDSGEALELSQFADIVQQSGADQQVAVQPDSGLEIVSGKSVACAGDRKRVLEQAVEVCVMIPLRGRV